MYQECWARCLWNFLREKKKALLLYFINSTNFRKHLLGYNSPNAKYNTCQMNSKSPYLSLSLFPHPFLNSIHTAHTFCIQTTFPLSTPSNNSKPAAATSLTTNVIPYVCSGLIPHYCTISAVSHHKLPLYWQMQQPLVLLELSATVGVVGGWLMDFWEIPEPYPERSTQHLTPSFYPKSRLTCFFYPHGSIPLNLPFPSF